MKHFYMLAKSSSIIGKKEKLIMCALLKFANSFDSPVSC